MDDCIIIRQPSVRLLKWLHFDNNIMIHSVILVRRDRCILLTSISVRADIQCKQVLSTLYIRLAYSSLPHFIFSFVMYYTKLIKYHAILNSLSKKNAHVYIY